jgi:hypothetical protein
VKQLAVFVLIIGLAAGLMATHFSVGMGFVLNQDRQTKEFDLQFFGRAQVGWMLFSKPVLGIIADVPVFGFGFEEVEFYSLDPMQALIGLYAELGLEDLAPSLPPAFFKATAMTELSSVLAARDIKYLPLVSPIGAGYDMSDFSLELATSIINVGIQSRRAARKTLDLFPHFHLAGGYNFDF